MEVRQVFLVSEADAGSRDAWPGPDRLRPITRDGWRQAREVAERLRGRRVPTVVASPWLRCRQTVQPLADELGLDVGEERALAEWADLEAALSVISALPDGAVACTHDGLARAILAQLGLAPETGEIGPWVIAR